MGISSGSESIARAYAQALYNVALAQGTLRPLIDEARDLAALLKAQPRIGYFLESPQISIEKKRVLIEGIFHREDSTLNHVFKNLVKMMIDRERAVILVKILEEFEAIAERADRIYPARVTSARELAEDEKQRLQAGMEKYTGFKLKMSYGVKPDLLGGIVFRCGDMLIDGSLRYELRQMKERLDYAESAFV